MPSCVQLTTSKLFTKAVSTLVYTRYSSCLTILCVQDDYRAWELPHRDAPPPVAPRVSVPFDAETSYHDTYHAHPLEAPTRHHAEPWKGMYLRSIPPWHTCFLGLRLLSSSVWDCSLSGICTRNSTNGSCPPCHADTHMKPSSIYRLTGEYCKVSRSSGMLLKLDECDMQTMV